jgi:hypothetical protein
VIELEIRVVVEVSLCLVVVALEPRIIPRKVIPSGVSKGTNAGVSVRKLLFY